jgi:hypothetical protein
VWAELLDLVAVRIGEVDAVQATEMLDECGVGEMMRCARGGPLDTGPVIEAICAISTAGTWHPVITGIEVNPLMVGRSRAVAVDCLITVATNAKGKGNER